MSQDKPAPDELIARREAQLARERVWYERLRQTLEDFPVVPFGRRVVVLQRQPEHKTKGGLLLPQSKDAPLSGYVVAVPWVRSKWFWSAQSADELVLGKDRISLRVGDEVLFPDFAGHRISVMVGLEGEEQRKQEFLVIDAADLHGKVVGGTVQSIADVLDPFAGEDTYATGKAVNTAFIADGPTS